MLTRLLALMFFAPRRAAGATRVTARISCDPAAPLRPAETADSEPELP